MNINDYEPVTGFVVPAYRYIEGREFEKYWIDSNSLEYKHYTKDCDNETNTIMGKNWWLIYPYKPKGIKLTIENSKELIKWIVNDSSLDDVDKEWSFETHKPIEDEES